MKKLYDKNELRFSLVWIVAYVVLFSAADALSARLGTAKLVTAPVTVLMALFLLCWLRKHGLWEKYGLCMPGGSLRRYLYFLPLVLIASTNLWFGAALRFSVPETVLYVVSMLGVGLIEELLFRGFLFKTLCAEGVGRAIAVSSITFGLGHIVNLLNGAEAGATLLQLCYAAAVGFLFTVIFYKSGSLLPCIAAHSAINVLSAFGAQRPEGFELAGAAALTLLSLAYGAWLLKKATA